jgi:hypothetical protein
MNSPSPDGRRDFRPRGGSDTVIERSTGVRGRNMANRRQRHGVFPMIGMRAARQRWRRGVVGGGSGEWRPTRPALGISSQEMPLIGGHVNQIAEVVASMRPTSRSAARRRPTFSRRVQARIRDIPLPLAYNPRRASRPYHRTKQLRHTSHLRRGRASVSRSLFKCPRDVFFRGTLTPKCETFRRFGRGSAQNSVREIGDLASDFASLQFSKRPSGNEKRRQVAASEALRLAGPMGSNPRPPA